MNKKEVISIISKISEIKENTGLKIIDTHVHPMDVMGVAHYSDVINECKKGDYFNPGILEKLNYGKIAQIGSRLYAKIFSEDVNKMIKKAYARVSEKTVLDEMDACLVDSVVMLPIAPWLPAEIIQEKFLSSRFISLATVDIHNLKLEEIESYLKNILDQQKIKGIKLHPNLQNFLPQPSQNKPDLAEKLHLIYKFAEKNKLYILIHGGTSFYTDFIDKKYSGNISRSRTNSLLKNFFHQNRSELFENYNVPVIIAHLGHYGITNPDYTLIKKIAQKFENVYFDTAGVSPNFIKNVLQVIPSQRVIFGSDALYNRMAYNIAFLYEAVEKSHNGEKKEDMLFNIFYKNYSKFLVSLLFLACFIFIPNSFIYANIAPSSKTEYAYDAFGQRAKKTVTNVSLDTATQNTTTTVEITYYVTKNYNLTKKTITVTDKDGKEISKTTSSETTKHIFANGAPVATITGSGADAKTNIILTDHLSGSNIVLDQNNQAIETTEYYPFGEILANSKPANSTFSEQRKYIGQEFDPDTALSYLNARYYNGTIAKFLSPDPVSLHTPEQLLSDPQQLNLYSYARNNPINLSDPSGLRSVLGIKDVAGIGAHGDIIIFPEQGENFSQYGNGPNYIIAGGPDYASTLSKPWGNLKASISSGNFNQSDYIKTITLEGDYIPNGMTVAQYDQALAKSSDNLSKQDLGPYSPTGRPISPWANSGNVWTQVILDAGGKVPEIQGNYPASGLFGSNTIHLPLGSGSPMNTLWFPATAAKNTYNATKGAVVSTATAVKNTAAGVGNYIGSTIRSVSKSITAPTSSFLNSLKLR